MRIFVIGASGRVGRCLLQEGGQRGHRFTAQTRAQGKIAASENVSVAQGSPLDRRFLEQALPGHDAVVFVLGIDHRWATTLFSEATALLISSMQTAGVRRLVAVTGVGTGESRGHGGWFYNLVIFPLFTRNRYRDKEKQEALIEASELEWTIIRPAPFSEAPASNPFQIFDRIPTGLQLTKVHPREVATFILDELEQRRHLGSKLFIGH